MKILGRELSVNNNSVYHTGNNPSWQEIQSKPSTFPPSSHNHNTATNSTSGFMSATDKGKLDGIATGANNYTHPTNAGNKHIPSGGASGQILIYGGSSGTATWGNQIQISNTLTDSSATNALSANQGKILKGLIDGKADSNHVHSNYLTTIPNKIDKSIIFEANGEVQRVQPSTAGSPCYYTFYKDKSHRSGYLGYESTTNNNFVIKNEVANANLDLKTTGNGVINLNSLQIAGGNTVQHSGSIVLRADSDASSASEYALIKAGHNELKVHSSAGGSTVTKGQDKLTFNNNVVYHAGNKPSATELGVVPTSDYTLYTITKNLQVTTSWMDTGIVGNNLPSGSYIVQISGMTSEATNTWYEIWTGTMSWYNGTTNSTLSDEILLHNTGHASNDVKLYLRTIRSAGGGYVKLQIASSRAFTKATNVTFKFRKLI